MITAQIRIEEVDLDRIFDVYFDKAKEFLASSDDPAAALMSRVPGPIAKKIWYGLSVPQKERIAAGLLEARLRELRPTAEQKLREQAVDLRLGEITVTSQ